MISALSAERARTDIEVLSRAGLGVDDFLNESIATLGRIVPSVAVCVGMHDSVTDLLTSGRKFGDLVGRNTGDPLWGMLEYGGAETTVFGAIARSATPALGMHAAGKDAPGSSVRMDQLIRPMFDYGDELRLAFRDDVGLWGGAALFRGSGDPPFAEAEVAWAAGLSDAFARGIRVGILTQLASEVRVDTAVNGPAVVVIDGKDEIVRMSVGAQQRLLQLGSSIDDTDPIGTVYALVTAARRVAATGEERLPRVRVRTRSGVWLILHASPLTSCDGTHDEVVVTIEEARPSEIVDLIVAAFALTPRERDVTALVLRGAETKEIAATLHVSAYTVQDHLKSVFDKAGVRSRRELVTRIWMDQYLTRAGQPVGPSGWFALER